MRIAINGFGRIGKIFFRQAFGLPGFDIVAINDLGDVANLAYLLEYDSVYGRYRKPTTYNLQPTASLVVDGKEIPVFGEKDPQSLPWRDLQIDVVVESTGVFTSMEKAKAHIDAGAKRVVTTAPSKDEMPTLTPNVGMDFLSEGLISSNASCTTNAATPVAVIMMQNPGIEKAMLNTVHGYTATQSLVDSSVSKDFLRGRAAACNIVPSSTGAAESVTRVIPPLKGLFDGIALRVPVISGSIIDFTFLAKRNTSVEEINDILVKAANEPQWQGIVKTTSQPLVSTDILGEPYGSIADLSLTRVVGGDLVKICSWYDNEWGYCAMLIKHIERLKELL